jgi:hypothetical protein
MKDYDSSKGRREKSSISFSELFLILNTAMNLSSWGSKFCSEG